MKKEIENRLGVADVGRRLSVGETAMLAKLESSLIKGGERYCDNKGYEYIPVPHLTRATGACENFLTLFSTDMFGKTLYLNQTGQLLLEAFMDSFEKTYTFGPSFRKEDKADERHLIEFNLFEIEVANTNLYQLQKEASSIIDNMLANAELRCQKELEHLVGSADLSLLKSPYSSITYTEAITMLNRNPEYEDLKFGDDLKARHEQELVNMNGGKPLFVTHYPQQIKFFNMRENRSDEKVVNSMDLLMPYSGETIGAAEREEDYRILMKRLGNSDMFRLMMQAIKMEPGYEDISSERLHDEAMGRFQWYLNIIEKNPIPHAGFGMGMTRLMQAILKTDDIRYATAFPLNRENHI